MNTAIVLSLLLLLSGLAYQMGWSRSRALATPEGRLHSRPRYHGALAALWTLVPAVLIFAIWAAFSDTASDAFIVAQLPQEVASLPERDIQEAMRRIHQVASGFGVIGDTQPYENAAAQALRRFETLTFALTQSPEVQTDLAAAINEHLRHDGYRLIVARRLSGSPIYEVKPFALGSPADDEISQALADFDPDTVHTRWTQALDRRDADPKAR